MNSMPVRLVLKQIGTWFVLLGIVVLLTVLFSILGTISCSVLAGMMTGVARRWKWQAVPISLVFPLVVVATNYMLPSKSNLEWRQILSFALLCFGAFWGIYLVTMLLMLFERNSAVDSAPPPASTSTLPEIAQPASREECLLADFLGQWWSETMGADGQPHRKLMQIGADGFILSETSSDGQLHQLARGDVKWTGTGRLKELIIAGEDESPAKKNT